MKRILRISNIIKFIFITYIIFREKIKPVALKEKPGSAQSKSSIGAESRSETNTQPNI